MPQVLEEIVALVACRRQATARVDVHCACRLQAPGDSTGGRALRLSLTGARRQHGWTCKQIVGKQIVDGPFFLLTASRRGALGCTRSERDAAPAVSPPHAGVGVF